MSTPGKSGFYFILFPLETETCHFKNLLLNFQHNLFTDIHTNTGGITCPVRKDFEFYTL